MTNNYNSRAGPLTYRSGILTGVVGTAIVAALGWWVVAGPRGEAAKTAPPAVPATIPKPFKEDLSTTFTLTPEAEQRLALQFGTIESKPMPRRRTFGGEVVVPPGRSVIVAAPLAGTLKLAETNLAPGQAVAKGRPVYNLIPLLDPVGLANLAAARVDADGQVQNAAEQVKLATIAFERAKSVLAGGAGSQRMVDEAQTQVDIAKKLLEATTARRAILDKVLGEANGGSTAPIPLASPTAGVIRTVSAQPGQTVPAGAALVEVIDASHMWVRVPVYVGDQDVIDATAATRVGALAARTGSPTRPATPVAAPPSANAAVSTVDLFYALDNRRWAPGAAVLGYAAFALDREPLYNPGQRVGVSVPLKSPTASPTVPWTAVVIDVNGGTWVYEPNGNHAFTRRRVEVRYVADGVAVLESSPPIGTKVVTAGAAELFGAEAGFSK